MFSDIMTRVSEVAPPAWRLRRPVRYASVSWVMRKHVASSGTKSGGDGDDSTLGGGVGDRAWRVGEGAFETGGVCTAGRACTVGAGLGATSWRSSAGVGHNLLISVIGGWGVMPEAGKVSSRRRAMTSAALAASWSHTSRCWWRCALAPPRRGCLRKHGDTRGSCAGLSQSSP